MINFINTNPSVNSCLNLTLNLGQLNDNEFIHILNVLSLNYLINGFYYIF